MQKLFANLYASLINLAGGHKTIDFPIYKNQIFSIVGWLTLLLLGLGWVLVYYYAFNSSVAFLGRAWNRAGQWWLTLLLAAGSAAWLAYGFSNGKLVAHDQYLGYFMVINALLGALWFFLWSVLLKRKSGQASTTPFAWPTFSR